MKWLTMWLMRRYIRKHWGNCRPNDFERHCPCCKAWAVYEYLFDLPIRKEGEE